MNVFIFWRFCKDLSCQKSMRGRGRGARTHVRCCKKRFKVAGDNHDSIILYYWSLFIKYVVFYMRNSKMLVFLQDEQTDNLSISMFKGPWSTTLVFLFTYENLASIFYSEHVKTKEIAFKLLKIIKWTLGGCFGFGFRLVGSSAILKHVRRYDWREIEYSSLKITLWKVSPLSKTRWANSSRFTLLASRISWQ